MLYVRQEPRPPHFFRMAWHLCILLLTIWVFCQPWISQVGSAPLNLGTDAGLQTYLRSYGYLGDSVLILSSGDPQGSNLENAIRQYQEFFGLPQTGVVDAATRTMMEQPRCGVSDIKPARYSLTPKYWILPVVTWNVGRTHFLIPEADARRVIEESIMEWSKWMNNSRLQLREALNPNATIIIDFVRPDSRGRHGDGQPFHPSTLAHAFAPDEGELAGNIHVNMERRFSVHEPPTSTETSLKLMLKHELGHSLGLGHSKEKNSVMYPVLPPGVPDHKLTPDDIYGIKALYGTCRNGPCLNGGTCVELARVPEVFCLCPATHTGDRCEKECTNTWSPSYNCDDWAARGECYINAKVMENICYKSCSKCHIRKCINLHTFHNDCDVWAAQGRCSTERQFMWNVCYKSCSGCSPQGCHLRKV